MSTSAAPRFVCLSQSKEDNGENIVNEFERPVVKIQFIRQLGKGDESYDG
jgi:hypothetical protein